MIAAAGFGTRFLPATKVVPKELLPLIDRPIIQYLVEELVASDIKEIIIVTRSQAPLIQDHFSSKVLHEEHLLAQSKKELLLALKKIGKMANISFIEQKNDLPYGTGAPILSVADKIKKDEFFVVVFGDDLVKAKIPAARQLIKYWQERPSTVVLGVQEMPLDVVDRYGIVKFRRGSKDVVENFVEKPKAKDAPSRFASFGRFVLNRQIIDILQEQVKEVPQGKEFCLTSAIAAYAQRNHVLARPIEGKWLTTGDPLSWLKASIEFALDREDLKKDLKTYLKSLK